MNPDEIDPRSSIEASYSKLRWSMAGISIILPVSIVIFAYFVDKCTLQNSMSDYYHSSSRQIFVFSLILISYALWIYKGYHKNENIAFNFAGLFLFGVAMFPMSITQEQCIKYANGEAPFTFQVMHGICAVFFFVCLMYICFTRAKDTIHLLKSTEMEKKFTNIYNLFGSLFILIPLLSVAFLYLVRMDNKAVFFIEAIAIWVFSAFWITKSIEIKTILSKGEICSSGS